MNLDSQELDELPRDECLRLLASVPFGRIIYTLQALPAVAVVNFAVYDGSVVFRADGSRNLEAATRHTVVAFEADELDPDTHTGWRVTVIGPADGVTDAGEITALSALGLDAWAPAEHTHFIRVRPEIVTGRRIHPAPA